MFSSNSCCALAVALFLPSSLSFFAQNPSTSPQPSAPIGAVVQDAVAQQPPPTPESLGDSLMAHRRYQAAIEAYKQVKPSSAPVWNKMGIAYQMMFNGTDAVRCYQASLRLDPKNSNVLNNLGTIFDSQKDYGSAVRMYRKALKIDPKSPLILKNMGTDLLAQHKFERGWEYYKQALAIDPEIFDRNAGPRVENPASIEQRGAMNYYMAKGCVRAGDTDRAIEYLRMALTEGFTNPKKLASDGEFAGLHGIPAFDRLLAETEKQ
jgi:Tfp pilus assembly protein PilF